MKGIFIVLDGLGDLPVKQLNGRTPLEAADTPNLDFLATRGQLGMMHSVKPGFAPESDQAIVSMFGNDLIDSTRGQLEARGTDLKLTRGDLALRVNFATIDSLKEGNIIDRRAGRTLTTEEAQILAKALNKIELPCKFEFKPAIQHRAVFILRGGFSDNVTGNDSTYSGGKIATGAAKIGEFRAMDDDENTQYTVNLLKEFIEKAFSVLNEHPVNQERRRKGLLPANFLLMRGAGIEPPKLKIYRKWMALVYMPLEIGFAKTAGMKVFSFDYPKLKGLDSYENYKEGLEKACSFSIKTLKKQYKNFDYAYIHIKETDLPGHDNKPLEKKHMIEYLDKTIFKFLAKFAPPNNIRVVVTADHSTPCKLKAHSDDPVPVLFYSGGPPKVRRFRFTSFLRRRQEENPAQEKDNSEKKQVTSSTLGQSKGEKFSEKNARKGTLGLIQGKELLDKVGFTR